MLEDPQVGAWSGSLVPLVVLIVFPFICFPRLLLHEVEFPCGWFLGSLEYINVRHLQQRGMIVYICCHWSHVALLSASASCELGGSSSFPPAAVTAASSVTGSCSNPPMAARAPTETF